LGLQELAGAPELVRRLGGGARDRAGEAEDEEGEGDGETEVRRAASHSER
jgi:hypothetical protein